jgi:uncharacterized membrane protein YdbT with pleckstrin-like domain
MSYVKSVLQPGERVKMLGRLHWIVYWPAFLFLVAAIAIVPLAGPVGPVASYASGASALLAIYFFLRGWFIRWITEIAVTDRRIIYKRGFITRHTEEMNMDKVTSVDVDQSILGRILDYGTVHVIGVGGAVVADHENRPHDGIEHLHRIAEPLALRNAITAK